MTTVINTNLASLFAQNSLSNAQNNLAVSVQRLSSGLRINSAKDDAAGLAIAQNMQGQINGVNQSISNLSDATNLLQTADTSLASVQDMLLRMKQLAVQGYNGSLNVTQKNALANELGDLNSEINATASRTAFNGINLLSNANSVDTVTGAVTSAKYLTSVATAIVAPASGAAASVMDASGTVTALNAPSLDGSATVSYSLSLVNDDQARLLSGDYTFTVNQNQITLSRTDGDNEAVTLQTLVVEGASYDDTADHSKTQVLNFDKFGITLTLDTVVPETSGNFTGANIADAFNGNTFSIEGTASKITELNVSGAAAGGYQFSQGTSATGAGASAANAQVLKVSWTDTLNNTHSEEVSLANLEFKAGTDTIVSFQNSAISFKIHNFQDRDADDIVAEISGLVDTQAANAGLLNVTSDGNSRLGFQSGATTQAYININTINIQTSTSGNARGSAGAMLAVGTAMSDIAGLSQDAGELPAWQVAFKAAADSIDNALEYISTQRAIYGSQMNRLSFVTTNLQATSTNLQNSRSAIIDTDFAAETAKLTKGQIMQQAATAMLAQANQMPNVILSLLK
jgi:flagellin